MKDSSSSVCVVSDENRDWGSLLVSRCCLVSASVLCDKVWSQHSCWLGGLTLSSLLINSSDIRTAATGRAPSPSSQPPSSCRRRRWRQKCITGRCQSGEAQTDMWTHRKIKVKISSGLVTPSTSAVTSTVKQRMLISHQRQVKLKFIYHPDTGALKCECSNERKEIRRHLKLTLNEEKAKIQSNLLMKRLQFSFHCFIHDMYLTPIGVVWSRLLGVVLPRPSL